MAEGNGNKAVLAQGLTKFYGPVRAVENVDLGLEYGEVLALVGDNGAGKSTLMHILAGAVIPDRGHIWIDGLEVKLHSPHDAQARGVAVVYQDLALVDQRDITANLFLGREPSGRFGVVQRRRMEQEAQRVVGSLRIRISSVRTLVGNLSGGQRQAVALGRAILQGGRIVLMDEPTAALGVRESTMVLDLIQHLATSGASVMIISHNLRHVLSVADRICVMRQGHVVGVRRVEETDEGEIVGLIVGREGLNNASREV